MSADKIRAYAGVQSPRSRAESEYIRMYEYKKKYTHLNIH